MTSPDPIALAETEAATALKPEIALCTALVDALMDVAQEALDTLTGHRRVRDPPRAAAQRGARVITGGQRPRQDRFTVVSRVIMVEGTRVVWLGSTRVVRNGATDDQLIGGLAADVVASLLQAGVLRKP